MINTNKIRQLVINILITSVLISIVFAQTVWLINIHNLYKQELITYSNQAAKDAVLKEISERTEAIGGWSVYSNNITNPKDTSRYFTKKIISEDSIYHFIIDKQDRDIMPKIIQFLLRDDLPINLDNLNKIFQERIAEKYIIKSTYFDYVDLKKSLLLKTNKSTHIESTQYFKTDTIPLDILNSIGVVGYIKVANNTILKKMRNQLILSASLIIIVLISLIYISRSFIFQLKTEKMRQDSINAMTHEFKRPIAGALAMISSMPHYLKKNEINKVLTYLDNIEIELNKLTHYTKRIQQISNNEKENVYLEKTKVGIASFFESLKQRYSSSENDQQRVFINIHYESQKQCFNVDLLHFSNVMDNLIENAIKYTLKSNVVIDVTVSDSTEGLAISVRDNGIGISSSDRNRIFEKFYRVKRDETKNKIGFGLGLTYAKSIVEAHEGHINVKSLINEGSEFIITLKA